MFVACIVDLDSFVTKCLQFVSIVIYPFVSGKSEALAVCQICFVVLRFCAFPVAYVEEKKSSDLPISPNTRINFVFYEF
jgi:hypothetical protein